MNKYNRIEMKITNEEWQLLEDNNIKISDIRKWLDNINWIGNVVCGEKNDNKWKLTMKNIMVNGEPNLSKAKTNEEFLEAFASSSYIVAKIISVEKVI